MAVYTPVKEIKIQANHGKKNTYYIVGYSYMDWDGKGKDIRPAIYIMMEYNGVRNYHLVANITTDKNQDGKSDFDNVMAAVDELRKEFNI
ncbi:hypothetical protein ABE65_010460 [Fictibacillus phosphorivorans]|uniref:Uncharacterized protein n=1 Tax=Fictibacillus phosphorivorans TaxID=1221500 RepID=A0A160INQ7_9BACL|nr:hypothetical protein [Fictibacillus phosphorivorans]ANC77202.1 hypothetical protein ABE65_010460 [Fictibacillus phosphorivorans]